MKKQYMTPNVETMELNADSTMMSMSATDSAKIGFGGKAHADMEIDANENEGWDIW